MTSVKKEARFAKAIGKNVLVDEYGEGVLRFFGVVNKKGDKKCGVELTENVVSVVVVLSTPPLLMRAAVVNRGHPRRAYGWWRRSGWCTGGALRMRRYPGKTANPIGCHGLSLFT